MPGRLLDLSDPLAVSPVVTYFLIFAGTAKEGTGRRASRVVQRCGLMPPLPSCMALSQGLFPPQPSPASLIASFLS